MYRGGFYRGGPEVMSAIAGIDQALWDIKGKYYNAPIYEPVSYTHLDVYKRQQLKHSLRKRNNSYESGYNRTFIKIIYGTAAV